MLKNYAKCVYLESKGSPVRALRIVSGLFRARTKYNIGPLHYSLFRFVDTPRAEWRSYLRDTEFFARVLGSANSDDMRRFLKDKVLFYQHCLDHGLPTPSIICVVAQPTTPVSSTSIAHVSDLDQWRSAIESAPSELFVKPIDGSYGSGAFIIRRLEQHFTFGQGGAQGSLEDLYLYVLQSLKNEKALLVQPRILAHPKILDISSGNALATIRVVTAMANNNARILYACAKLPVGTNITDNFSHGSSGNLVAAVDIATGALSEGWCSARSDWPVMQSTDVHPDTGHQIRGSVLPLWRDVIDLALEAQNSLPKIRTIGWDIAITAEGVMLIEANGGYNIGILQVAHQRGLGGELMSQIECQNDPTPA